jgi:hypothetical protein
MIIGLKKKYVSVFQNTQKFKLVRSYIKRSAEHINTLQHMGFLMNYSDPMKENHTQEKTFINSCLNIPKLKIEKI